MTHVHDIVVRFGDTDPAGIVYYPTLFHYFHVAFESFFLGQHGLDYSQWIADRRVGFPTVHVEADFVAPFRYGEVARLEVSIARVGTKSIDFRFEATPVPIESNVVEDPPERAGRVGAVATIAKSVVDLDRLEPIPIPADLIPVLERHRHDPGDDA